MMESGTGTGGGLMWAVGAIFLLIVLAVFIPGRGFGRDGGYEGYRGGHEDGYCDVKGCRPAYYDESNWEQESHLEKALCKVDSDVHKEGEETRELINCNTIQALRDVIGDKNLALAEKNQEIQTLRFEKYTDAKFGAQAAELAEIKCKMFDKPNVYPYSYIECQPRPCNNSEYERPRRCGEEWAA